mmetsp:Transcript_22069/g.61836  ORF Transcript_22069/g.61836 Transcript_22069/m.61836 type:complete len:548 (-) Transcript_22069:93-1736(-)
MLSPFLLGIVPSLANSLVAVSIEYFSQRFNSYFFFYHALVLLNLATIVAVALTYLDAFFDTKYDRKHVVGVRLFVPPVLLLCGFAAMAFAEGQAWMLAAISAVGFSTALVNVASFLCFGVATKNPPIMWNGIAAGSLLSVGVCLVVGFVGSNATVEEYHGLLGVAGITTLVLMGPVAMLYATEGLDDRFVESLSILEQPSEDHATTGIQTANVFFTCLVFPLLPYFLPFESQRLVFWKLLLDCIGAIVLLKLPAHIPMYIRGVLVVARVCFFAAFFLLASPTLRLVAWDAFMCFGIIVSGLNDTAGDVAERKDRIRRNRFATAAGTILSQVVAGFLIYQVLPDGMQCVGCARIAPSADAVCRTQASTADATADSPLVEVFSYGANLDCAKLDMIGVVPRAARVTTLPGQCLAFGVVPGLGDEFEPGFATLRPCDGGCVHGVAYSFTPSDYAKLSASERGYFAHRFRDKTGETTLAYVMQGPFTLGPVSPRYGGKVFCARQKLGRDVGEELACQLRHHGVSVPTDCSQEWRTWLPKLTVQANSTTRAS